MGNYSLGNNEIENLIYLLSKIPGLGPRSARRATLHLIKKRDTLMYPIVNAISQVAQNIKICSVCGNIDTTEICGICTDEKRDPNILIIVEDVADLWALERSMILKAKYHILGGHLSPLDGIGEKDLNISSLISRVKTGSFKEIILALNATVESQTTAHYINNLLQDTNATITQIAQGVPLGGELDHLDEGTLSQAIGRRTKL